MRKGMCVHGVGPACVNRISNKQKTGVERVLGYVAPSFDRKELIRIARVRKH